MSSCMYVPILFFPRLVHILSFPTGSRPQPQVFHKYQGSSNANLIHTVAPKQQAVVEHRLLHMALLSFLHNHNPLLRLPRNGSHKQH